MKLALLLLIFISAFVFSFALSGVWITFAASLGLAAWIKVLVAYVVGVAVGFIGFSATN